MDLELTYTKIGDYYYPDIALPDTTKYHIGRYGRMHQRYLKEHRPVIWGQLSLMGDLSKHLFEIDTACNEQMRYLIKEMAKREGVTEALKAADPMTWVDEERLEKAIKWDLQKNHRPGQIALPVRGGLRKVEAKDILYAEAVNHKSAVHLLGEEIPVNLSFREMLSRLRGDAFCRCHHSFVVNLEHVLKQTTRGLLLDTGTELPVSRTYQQEITKRFIAFLK